MRDPEKYTWAQHLVDQPAQPKVAAVWVGCFVLVAVFWGGVALLAEKLLP